MGYFVWCTTERSVCVDYNNNLWEIGTYKSSGILVKNSQLSNVRYVSCWKNFTACVSYEGEVFGFGRNSIGSDYIGIDTTEGYVSVQGFPSIIDVVCGENVLLCIDEEKNVWGCGKNFAILGLSSKITTASAPTIIKNLKNIIKIVVGPNFAIALDEYGDIFVCGDNSSGQLGVKDTAVSSFTKNTSVNKITDIACGNYHSLVLHETGKVFSCGINYHGEIGRETQNSKNCNKKMEAIETLPVIKKVMATGFGSKCLDEDNCLWVFGQNYCGDLGTQEKDIFVPVKIDLDNIDFVSNGGRSTIVKGLHGEIYVFGDNTKNELGFVNERRVDNGSYYYRTPKTLPESDWEILRNSHLSKAKSARK